MHGISAHGRVVEPILGPHLEVQDVQTLARAPVDAPTHGRHQLFRLHAAFAFGGVKRTHRVSQGRKAAAGWGPNAASDLGCAVIAR